MKRLLLPPIFVVLFSISSSAQVINFGKTLPVGAFSLTLAPLVNTSSVYHPLQEGMSYLVMATYGLGYDVDLSAKYAYTNGADYFGVQAQYLFREERKSYYSFYGGLHKWESYGIDLTVSYTRTPQYWANLTAGLDIDVDFSDDLELRAWIPLNFGINIDDRFFIFLEYDLPATERAWDILGGGVNFIFR